MDTDFVLINADYLFFEINSKLILLKKAPEIYKLKVGLIKFGNFLFYKSWVWVLKLRKVYYI